MSATVAVHNRQHMMIACFVAAVVSGLGGVGLLLRLARLTETCSSMDPAYASLHSALYSCHCRGNGLAAPIVGEEKKFYFELLRDYMSNRKVGVRLCGLLIDLHLVHTYGLRLCVLFPGLKR